MSPSYKALVFVVALFPDSRFAFYATFGLICIIYGLDFFHFLFGTTMRVLHI